MGPPRVGGPPSTSISPGEDGLVGAADLRVHAAADVWLEIVTKKRRPVLAVLTGRLRTQGDRALLGRFAACFPR